ncbi:UvrD-helicase domain-containing protein [Rhizobium leguminosarum]|uniref:UvrD-helicase domain-containing protein n=1 Tax=Rhizobium leguminosarum TaxID=384 RepID=UPI001AE457F9|nr:DNA helicase-2/ATP-dependent DNA helicase PcrA [Rhizobium leguminosarum]
MADFCTAALKYKRLGHGIVSHDEVIVLAKGMFETYPKIRDIIRDRFRYILVDEYQDTAPEVVKILLDFLPLSSRQGVCGFFGDAMQSIYDGTIGSIQHYVALGRVCEVKKEQNRRNPRLVFELANELRTDGIVQQPSKDMTAPNMANGVVKEGTIQFYHSSGEGNRLDEVRKQLAWDFSDVLETKELNLTHNLIAPQAGFDDLMAIYDKDGVLDFRRRIVKVLEKQGDLEKYDEFTFGEVLVAVQAGKKGSELNAVSPTNSMKTFIAAHPDLLADAEKRNFKAFRQMFVDKDQLVDDKKQNEEEVARKGSKRCEFIKHVFKIQSVVHLYQTGRYNDFLRLTEFRIGRAADKVRVLEYVKKISAMSDRPISEVIDYAHETGLCVRDDNFFAFKDRKSYLYDRVKKVNYRSFQNLYEYLEGRTTYSTQHKIKGREFDRVLVVLDAGGWNNYNFNYLLEGAGNPSVLERTQKLFYVCCTRAKEHLAVYFHNPSKEALKQATAWFGAEHIIEV